MIGWHIIVDIILSFIPNYLVQLSRNAGTFLAILEIFEPKKKPDFFPVKKILVTIKIKTRFVYYNQLKADNGSTYFYDKIILFLHKFCPYILTLKNVAKEMQWAHGTYL